MDRLCNKFDAIIDLENQDGEKYYEIYISKEKFTSELDIIKLLVTILYIKNHNCYITNFKRKVTKNFNYIYKVYYDILPADDLNEVNINLNIIDYMNSALELVRYYK